MIHTYICSHSIEPIQTFSINNNRSVRLGFGGVCNGPRVSLHTERNRTKPS